MDARLDKVSHHTHQTEEAPAFNEPTHESNPVEKKNPKQIEEKRAKEDKKSHEYGTVSLIYSSQAVKRPKSISTHSFNKSQNTNNQYFMIISKSERLFSRYVKMQAQIMGRTIKQEHEMKYQEAHWKTIKEIFHARLDEINKKRQAS